MSKFKKALPFIICITKPLALGGLSALLTMNDMKAYGDIPQPPLSPPATVFPVAWSILYVMMGIASALVWKSYRDDDRQNGLIYYGLQLVLNFFWPLVFFSAKEYWFAFAWLIALLAAVIATAVFFRRVSKAAFWLIVPYIAWLAFAAYLNVGVAVLN
ncbi:MAG: tryptophan-rich sensory protein [Clostridia bacterium]|nr:tryptophan-rich sensory protein [Clostridia bacterium]